MAALSMSEWAERYPGEKPANIGSRISMWRIAAKKAVSRAMTGLALGA